MTTPMRKEVAWNGRIIEPIHYCADGLLCLVQDLGSVLKGQWPAYLHTMNLFPGCP
jgi:hypothetical protein